MTPPCVECKHIKIKYFDEFLMPEIQYLCKKQLSEPSNIDGCRRPLKCAYNRTEYCSMFEQRIGIIQRVLNWFRRRK